MAKELVPRRQGEHTGSDPPQAEAPHFAMPPNSFSLKVGWFAAGARDWGQLGLIVFAALLLAAALVTFLHPALVELKDLIVEFFR